MLINAKDSACRCRCRFCNNVVVCTNDFKIEETHIQLCVTVTIKLVSFECLMNFPQYFIIVMDFLSICNLYWQSIEELRVVRSVSMTVIMWSQRLCVFDFSERLQWHGWPKHVECTLELACKEKTSRKWIQHNIKSQTYNYMIERQHQKSNKNKNSRSQSIDTNTTHIHDQWSKNKRKKDITHSVCSSFENWHRQ